MNQNTQRIYQSIAAKMLLSLFLLSGLVHTSHAQTYKNVYLGGIYIVDQGQRRFSDQDLNRELLTSVESEPFFRMVSLSKVNEFKEKFIDKSPVRIQRNKDLLRADKLLQVGKRMYHGLNFEKARDSLALSKKLYIKNLQYLRSNQNLLESHLYLGMTWLAIKKEKDAYNEFKKVAYLDPNFKMNATEYSPAVIPVFETARSEVKSKQVSTVTVNAEYRDTQVYVNGRLMGKTPLRLNLYAGDYFFLLEKAGLKPWYQLEKIRQSSQTVVGKNEIRIDQEQWASMFRVREGKNQASEDVKMLIEEAQSQGADYIMLSSLEKNINYRLMGQLYDISKQRFSDVALFNVEKGLGDFPGAVDEMVLTLKNKALGKKANLRLNVAEYGPAPVERKHTGSKKKWYKQWWIYPVAAGIIAAGVVGAGELGSSGSGGTIVINNN